MKPILQDRLAGFVFGKKGLTLSLSVSLLILAIFLIQMYGKAYREHGYDFTSYLLSSRALVEGSSPYNTGSPFPFIYPQFLCVILAPLTILPYWLSNLLWFIGNSSALYFSTVLLLRRYSNSLSLRDITALFLIPFLVLVNVIQNNLLNGQLNFIVLLLCTLFLRDYLAARRFTASLFLSAAIAIKLTPAILLIYLFGRRDFATVCSVLFGSVILIFALPYALGGPSTLDYYSEYMNSFLLHKFSSSGATTEGLAFSITSIVGVLLPSLPKLLSFIIGCGLSLAPVILMQLSLRGKETATNQAIVFSIYMSAILLIGPMSETHHLVNLLPAMSLMTAAMLSPSSRHFKAGAILLGLGLMSLISGTFYFPANIVAIISAYASMAWLIFQSNERATAWITE